MKIIAHTETVTTVPAEVLYARLADVASHPEWSLDLEWVRLDEPLAEGARGKLKPKGGPACRFVVSELVPGSVFADTTFLPGARLTFRHEVRAGDDTNSLRVEVGIAGPLAWLWRRTAFRGVQADIESDARHLVELTSAR